MADPTPAWRSIRRLYRPSLIEITRSSVVISNVSEVDEVRPRDRCYAVKYVGHARSVIIRTDGMEMIEIRTDRHAELGKWIAARMRETLGIESEDG